MLRPISFFLLTCLCFFPAWLHAQGVTISGRIVDSETLDPLPFAHVYIDQTTIGTTSDINGEYLFEHINDGDIKLVFSYVGYELYYKSVAISGDNLRVSARLIPQKELLQSVTVKGSKDKEWESQLKQFHQVFFGEKALAKDCKILNSWVLEFTYEKKSKVFKAVAAEPLQIENRALGYSIVCTLQDFTFDKKGYKIRGLYKFDELNTTDTKEAAKWTRNRRSAYQCSMRFLFKSIVDHHESQNGFDLYVDKRPANVTMSAAIFGNELNKNVFKLDMTDKIIPSGRPGYYKVILDSRIEIHHTTQFAQTKAYRDVSHPVSWIECEKGFVEVSSDGYIVNNQHLITSGELNGNRIASMLPTNYSPGNVVVVNYLTKRHEAMRLQERVHVQTDKGFYYAGETIWLKAFMNYANQSMRDSLSTVLYVEIIDPLHTVKITKLFNLENNAAHGNIELPPDWPPGKYYLRAYTSWMKNYGPDVLFHCPLAIMKKDQRLQSKILPTEGGDFHFVFEKRKFNEGEKIRVQVMMDSSDQDFKAWGSLSVTLAGQAVYPGALGIKESHFFPEDLPNGTLGDFIFPMEYGFSLQGRLFRPKKRTTTGKMSVIRGKLDSLYTFKTDSKGMFTIDDLRFKDTTRFSFQAKDKKGRIFGQTELLPREIPFISIPTMGPKEKLDTIQLVSPVEFKQPSAIDSSAVEKKKETHSDYSRSNSNFDLVLTEEDLKSSGNMNIINALQGRVPGFQITSSGKASFRSGGIGSDSEPLFLVDGIPINSNSSFKGTQQTVRAVETTRLDNSADGHRTNPNPNSSSNLNSTSTSLPTNVQSNDPGQDASSSAASMLSHITTDIVSRVEINSKTDPSYGSSGANGVISIYTKKAQGKTKEVKTFDVFIVKGFAVSAPFDLQDSTALRFNGDYQPTVYWMPTLAFSARESLEIIFTAPAKLGKYLIRIAAMSEEGKPLAGTVGFEVKEEAGH